MFSKYKNIESKLSSGKLALAQSIIAAFSPTTNIENNYKTFYTLQRAYLQNQDLTLLENIQLLLLAYQCPFTDGQVVYNARALYNLVNQTIVVYNDNNCRSKGFSFGRTQDSITNYSPEESELLDQLIVAEKNSKDKFKPIENYNLHPNPAQKTVYINSTNNENETVTIKITDTANRVLFQKQVEINNYLGKLNLDLIDGIYFVTITNKVNKVEVKKLIIVN